MEAVMEEILPVVPEICVVICGLRTAYVNVWEEIFVHAGKRKDDGICGLFLALSVVCMSLGSVIETNTLFLLAAASFFVGIVIRESG